MTDASALATPALRAGFPALAHPGRIYLDNPGGTQVHRSVLDAVSSYLEHDNANLDGPFETSRRSSSMLAGARADVAAFLGAGDEHAIVFGANMTTLTMHAARILTREMGAGDEILVTGLDHDGNVAPWLLAAEDRGVTIRQAGIDIDDCVVDTADFAAKLSDRTRVAAFGWASNGAGTVNDVAELVRLASQAGAITYVDAVQFAPHGPVDVTSLGCDFLVCSAYKFFGPHVGVLAGRSEVLERYRPYRVRPAPARPPASWETGTINLEGIAGTAAAVRYLSELDMEQVGAYERALTGQLLDGLGSIPGVTVYGTRDLDRRVPTVTFNVAGRRPAEVSAWLADHGVFVWDGNYYALELMQRLGLEDSGGAVRVGAAHYNTPEEIDRFLELVAAAG
ncbi:MAG TPA: cysteine desulfurase-like protein [Gaiellales bacterium]|nr:cysteine desulfurase-like protein [Gaiellales bacterium]